MATIETAVEIRPFRVEVREEKLDDLRRRQEPEIFTNELRAAFRSLHQPRRSS